MKTEYSVVFQEETEGDYSVWVPDLPGCASQGDSIEEAMANIKEAIALYLEDAPYAAAAETGSYKRQFVIPVQVTAHA